MKIEMTYEDRMAAIQVRQRMGCVGVFNILTRIRDRNSDQRDAAIMLKFEEFPWTNPLTTNPVYRTMSDEQAFGELWDADQERMKEQGHTCQDPVHEEYQPPCPVCWPRENS